MKLKCNNNVAEGGGEGGGERRGSRVGEIQSTMNTVNSATSLYTVLAFFLFVSHWVGSMNTYSDNF